MNAPLRQGFVMFARNVFRKKIWVVTALLLTACQAHNPLRGQSDQHNRTSDTQPDKVIKIDQPKPTQATQATPATPTSKPDVSPADGHPAGTEEQNNGEHTTCAPRRNTDNKLLVGEVEHVVLPELDLTLKARIDTGATTSSLHVSESAIFERDGQRWVAFKIPVDASGTEISIERPLTRTVLIKQKNKGTSIRRPVIEMQVKLGELEQKTELTLSDREGFEFTALIGRNFLKDMAIVDVSQKFLATSTIGEDKNGTNSKKP